MKARLRTVGNIGKITKAMKMVAAAKMRQVEAILAHVRFFQVAVRDVRCHLMPTTPQESLAGAWPARADGKEGEGVQKRLLVGVTSDRGLCGGINSSISKAIRNEIPVAEKAGQQTSVFVFGEKGKSALERLYGYL